MSRLIRVSDLLETFSELGGVLESLRQEEFTWDHDINFLQSFVRDPTFQALTEVNDRVSHSIGFENPVGAAERPFLDVRNPPLELNVTLHDIMHFHPFAPSPL